MLKLKKAAVTGGVASGKTTVCRIFQELGAYVVDADALVHQLLDPTTQLGKDLVALLGPEVVIHGEFDRRAIADKVFGDAETLNKVETLIHPKVQKELDAHYKRASEHNSPLFIAEIPLLFEAGFDINFDATIVVEAPKEACAKRFFGSQEDYERRQQRLLPIEQAQTRADYIITNNASLGTLHNQVESIFKSLI